MCGEKYAKQNLCDLIQLSDGDSEQHVDGNWCLIWDVYMVGMYL